MILFTILLVLLIFVALLLIGIIMMQSSEGGLSSSIGGASQITTTFGSSTPSVLVKTTTILAIIFASLTFGLDVYSLFINNKKEESILIKNAETNKTVQPLNLYEEPTTDNGVSQQETPLNSGKAETKGEENPFPTATKDSGK